ncbi:MULTISPECIES: ATP-grasp domain-containing protein [Bacillus]|uniref:ATP-grasp domain-containing protein n=1 Tax=Bacillus TaxID=1386 RepID=UPI0020CE06E5|nr:ATP-grasp domain-containing protein [Bacillus safensis]MCP9282882.1 ATP-grasp domain-containing protein [Bacillus safensis]
MKKILLIGRTIESILNDIPSNFSIVHITRKEDLKYGLGVFERPEKTLLMDYENLEELTSFCMKLHELELFDAVYAFSEEGLVPAATISKALNILGPDLESVKNTTNKLKMRSIIDKFPEINVGYQKVFSLDSISSFLKLYKEIILKPIDGFGSQGVIKISNEKDIEKAFNYCISYAEEMMMEEFVAGKQISVETFSNQGEHQILAITEKTMCDPPYCVSLSQLIPAKISSIEKQKIIRGTYNLLNAVNHKFGPAHVEMCIGHKEVKVIEIQLRPGGRIHDMLKYGLGYNIFSLTLNSLFGDSNKKISAPGSCCLFYITASPGIVSKIEGFDKVKSHPSVKSISLNVEIGDKVNPLTNNKGRIGHLICVGKDSESTYSIGKELLNEIQIITI